MESAKIIPNSIGIPLVKIPAGTYTMGLRGLENSEPLHDVTISAFWMGQFEVTNKQYEQFKRKPRPYESRGDNQPVTRITWEEATQFCIWLSKREKAHYRLPTEAEWEYAARGGLHQKRYPWGDETNTRGRATFGSTKTTQVGSYRPNRFGLYDMAGNVAEFVSDWYDRDYYKRSPRINPQGPSRPPKPMSEFRIYRGGSCTLLEGYCGLRSLWTFTDDRTWEPDDPNGVDGTGFRVVMQIE